PSAVHKIDPLARQVGKSSEVLGHREPLRLEAPHLAGRSRAPLRRFAADNPAHSRSKRARRYNESAIGFLRERREHALNVSIVAHASRCHRHPESGGSSFDHTNKCDICGDFRNVDDRYSTHSRCYLLEHPPTIFAAARAPWRLVAPSP